MKFKFRMVTALALILASAGCSRSGHKQYRDPLGGLPFVAGRFNVTAFGATGDGETDETEAFQAALDAAGEAMGGIVYAPTGQYRFEGRLTFPIAVTLEGDFKSVPSHAGLKGEGSTRRPRPEYGTVLLPTADRGDADAPPFLLLSHNCTLKGVSIYHPEQPRDSDPIPYPFSIKLYGDNAAVIDVEILNSYQGIVTEYAHRHIIKNVHGQPLKVGIKIDKNHDIGRLENVHFNPYWRWDEPIKVWMRENGVGFVFGRTDWHYALNTFCLGYKIGYHFIETEDGSPNGNFLGIGADKCETAVQIEAGKPQGLLFTNGEFVSVDGPNPVMIRITETFAGTARFTNCGYWGLNKQIAQIAGSGLVSFTDCNFRHWDRDDENLPAIEARGGSIAIRGCWFERDKPQVAIHEGVSRAIIKDNFITGETRIDVAPGVVSAVADNLAQE